MLKSTARFGLVLCFLFAASTLFASPSLRDIRDFSRSEIAAIKRRYPASKGNDELFTMEEFAEISSKNLQALVGELILHPKIKLESLQEVVEFAQKIAESGFDFKTQLQPRIERYLKEKMMPFIALDEAIRKEALTQWHQKRVKDVNTKNKPFVASVRQSRLSDYDKEKVIKLYAVCVASYENIDDRKMLQPNVCEPTSGYIAPRNAKGTSFVKTRLSPRQTEYASAYKNLMEEARRVANLYELDDFERMVMSKCIAEKSLRFFVPSHHPFKALIKEISRHTKTPEKALFMRSGICSNFSAITYNVARELGLDNQVFLVRKGVHVFLEFRVGKNWYHSHPFNLRTSCDMTRF